MFCLSRRAHACLHYPLYAGLLLFPLVFGMGMAHPMAFLLPSVVGLGGLLMTALTDHEAGLLAVVPFRLHLALETLAGLVLILAAFAYGFAGLDFAMTIGAGLLLVGLPLLGRATNPLCPAE